MFDVIDQRFEKLDFVRFDKTDGSVTSFAQQLPNCSAKMTVIDVSRKVGLAFPCQWAGAADSAAVVLFCQHPVKVCRFKVKAAKPRVSLVVQHDISILLTISAVCL
jgi:hypothetical protein